MGKTAAGISDNLCHLLNKVNIQLPAMLGDESFGNTSAIRSLYSLT